MISVATYWDNVSDDEVVYLAMSNFINRAVALGKEMGLYHPFVYMNYAHGTQDVYGGYGEENRERLRGVRGKYDQEGVFERLRSGGFRL